MQVSRIVVHNFRSLLNCTLHMGDYSLLVGANNSGKSNLIDAIRVFYEKSLKFEESRDFPKISTPDQESWIDIEYSLEDDEYAALKDEYRRPDNKVKVRKYLKTAAKGNDGKAKSGIYAYINNAVSDEHFYGAKNVQQGKLGDIIYVPAVSRLDDHTKLTGPSVLRDLVTDILKKLVKSSKSFASLLEQFAVFESTFKTEETDDQRSLHRLEQEINDDIQEWDAQFELGINPVSEGDIVKNLISVHVRDAAIGDRMEAAQFGQGFQRHLIYTLIRLAARYTTPASASSKKEFTPNMTLLLFEEPEAFLHPIQQRNLSGSLRGIGRNAGQQVLLSTHSEVVKRFETASVIN